MQNQHSSDSTMISLPQQGMPSERQLLCQVKGNISLLSCNLKVYRNLTNRLTESSLQFAIQYAKKLVIQGQQVIKHSNDAYLLQIILFKLKTMIEEGQKDLMLHNASKTALKTKSKSQTQLHLPISRHINLSVKKSMSLSNFLMFSETSQYYCTETQFKNEVKISSSIQHKSKSSEEDSTFRFNSKYTKQCFGALIDY